MRHLENEVKGLTPPSVPGFSSELQPCIQAEAPCRVQGKLVFACVPRASLLRATCMKAQATLTSMTLMPNSLSLCSPRCQDLGRQEQLVTLSKAGRLEVVWHMSTVIGLCDCGCLTRREVS